MADDDANPAVPPARLTPSEIAHLHRLGEAARQSSAPTTRQPAIHTVLTLSRRHRDRGVPVTAIATALGVDVETLFAWLLDTVPKPTPHPTPSPHPIRPIAPDITEHRTSSEHIMISGSIAQTATQSINAVSSARNAIDSTRSIAEPPAGLRTLLAVSGDPRPGGNVFGLEIAAVRTSLGVTRIRVHELHCPDLAELGQYLRAGPSILHVAAHSAFGGVFLSLDGHPSSIGDDAFAETVHTAPLPPKLIVLNICNSVALGKLLAGTDIPVLCWPTAVTDEQARQTAALFYRQLATGATVNDSHRDVCRTITPRWPGLDLPQLHGAADIRPL